MSPCSSCHAGCCRSFAVPVTGADVLRIEREVSLPFEQIACRWADPDGKISRGEAPQLYFDDDPQLSYVLCLQHETSAFHAGTTKCRFLVEGRPSQDNPLGEARCGIYPSRPSACRVFPTKFNSTSELVVLHDVPAHGRNDANPVYALCPRPWRSDEIDPLQMPQDLAVAKYEWEFFRTVARAWNRRPRPFAAFGEFLHVAYANRVLNGPETALDARPVLVTSARIGHAA